MNVQIISILLLVLVLSACSESPPPPPSSSLLLDLSHVVRQDMPHLPDDPLTLLQRDPDGSLQALTLGVRSGTSLELVRAADASLRSLEDLAAQDLWLPAVVIDMRDMAQDDPLFALSAADVQTWEARYGPIPPHSLILLATGWDVRWGDPAAYLFPTPADHVVAPGFAPDALEFLYRERQAAGFGLDAPLLQFQPTTGFVLLLTNLTALEQLPPHGAMIMVGALKLQATDHAPARVVAWISDLAPIAE